MSRSVVARVFIFLLVTGMVTGYASGETLLGRWQKCIDEAYLELNECLGNSGFWGDFKCDRAFEINEAACDLELLASLVWPF